MIRNIHTIFSSKNNNTPSTLQTWAANLESLCNASTENKTIVYLKKSLSCLPVDDKLLKTIREVATKVLAKEYKSENIEEAALDKLDEFIIKVLEK